MKTNPIRALSLLFILFLVFNSCNDYRDGLLWDVDPARVTIIVVDKNNNNLLDSATSNNILSNKIVATHNNIAYTFKERKTLAPKPLGLRLCNNPWDETKRIEFGEFWIEEKYQKESVTIDWGNGRIDKIDFRFKLKWKKDELKIYKQIWLNGKLADSQRLLLTIVMPDELLENN